MTSNAQFLKTLSAIPGRRADYDARLTTLTTAYGAKKAREVARDEFEPGVLAWLAEDRTEPPAEPEPKTPRPPRKPDPPDKFKRSSIDPSQDIEFVYQTWHLEGEALEQAKKSAPSPSSIGLLKQVQEDKKFRETFFDKLVNRVIFSQAKLDKGAKQGEKSQILLDKIDRALAEARKAASIEPDLDNDGDDDEGVALTSAQDAP